MAKLTPTQTAKIRKDFPGFDPLAADGQWTAYTGRYHLVLTPATAATATPLDAGVTVSAADIQWLMRGASRPGDMGGSLVATRGVMFPGVRKFGGLLAAIRLDAPDSDSLVELIPYPIARLADVAGGSVTAWLEAGDAVARRWRVDAPSGAWIGEWGDRDDCRKAALTNDLYARIWAAVRGDSDATPVTIPSTLKGFCAKAQNHARVYFHDGKALRNGIWMALPADWEGVPNTWAAAKELHFALTAVKGFESGAIYPWDDTRRILRLSDGNRVVVARLTIPTGDDHVPVANVEYRASSAVEGSPLAEADHKAVIKALRFDPLDGNKDKFFCPCDEIPAEAVPLPVAYIDEMMQYAAEENGRYGLAGVGYCSVSRRLVTTDGRHLEYWPAPPALADAADGDSGYAVIGRDTWSIVRRWIPRRGTPDIRVVIRPGLRDYYIAWPDGRCWLCREENARQFPETAKVDSFARPRRADEPERYYTIPANLRATLRQRMARLEKLAQRGRGFVLTLTPDAVTLTDDARAYGTVRIPLPERQENWETAVVFDVHYFAMLERFAPSGDLRLATRSAGDRAVTEADHAVHLYPVSNERHALVMPLGQ